MWIYRLVIRIRGDGELRVFGEENELIALRQEIQALIDSGEERTVTYRTRGQVKTVNAREVESLSDVDPVIAPEDLPTPIG